MSGSLYWKPKKEGRSVGNFPLRNALQARYQSFPHTLTEDDVPYLQGLADGGVEGADKLIQAIEKHGEIEIEVVY